MNAAETIAAMRAEVEDVKAKLHNLDPRTVGDLPERVARMEAALTTAAEWHGVEEPAPGDRVVFKGGRMLKLET